MSKTDIIFQTMCQDILTNGTDTKGEAVRPHWPDGTPAYTIKQFGVCNKYDLSEEFPALTLRPTGIKSATDELLWIWQKKSNNIHELNSHIWDSWADETGSIGKAYGYQLGILYPAKNVTKEQLERVFEDGIWVYSNETDIPTFIKKGNPDCIYAKWNPTRKCYMLDQVNKVIYDLKTTPFSRRILTSIYTFADLDDMALHPCAYSMTFNVTQDPKTKELILNSILNQRSNDVLAANNWNVVQYAILTMMLAQVCNMKAGTFIHMIADAHIYDKHVPIIQELITRTPFPAPKVTLNPEIHNFYDFTPQDVYVENYQKHPPIKNIPIAI